MAVAMKILDPHLKDGVHEWRDGKRFVKEGAKLYLEGTDTLAGRCVPPISDARSCLQTVNLPQRRHPRQLRPELLAVHGMFAGRGDKMRDVQSGTVPRHRGSERDASSGRGRRLGRS